MILKATLFDYSLTSSKSCIHTFKHVKLDLWPFGAPLREKLGKYFAFISLATNESSLIKNLHHFFASRTSLKTFMKQKLRSYASYFFQFFPAQQVDLSSSSIPSLKETSHDPFNFLKNHFRQHKSSHDISRDRLDYGFD